jgi:hypothetical protein
VRFADGADHDAAAFDAKRQPKFGVLGCDYLEGARELLLVSECLRRNVERNQCWCHGHIPYEALI